MSSLVWKSSNSPPPLEYWLEEPYNGPTAKVYIRRGKRMEWSIVRYKGQDDYRNTFDVLAGPFDTLDTAKVAWRLMFPLAGC